MNDIVSFETAVLLKELGFDYKVSYTYDPYRDGSSLEVAGGSLSNIDNYNKYELAISAPHLYEAQKWLRDQYDIHVEVWYNFFYSCWEISLFDLTKSYDRQKRQIVREMIQKNTYEEALESGIQDSLIYLKSMKDARTTS